MNKQRIIEILEVYRPGEGLESDPEVAHALELAAKDPELAKYRESIREFDQAFASKLQSIEVPGDLRERIMAAAEAREATAVQAVEPEASGRIINWFHPMVMAAAAAIVLFLALSFTFWNRPGDTAPELVAQTSGITDSRLVAAADALYASLSPSFHSQQGSEILDYLKSQGGAIPATMPTGFSWDHSFACDVIEIDGARVSIVCFKSPDNSNTLHMFTFNRSDFPACPVPANPEVRTTSTSCSAMWSQGEHVHVLFSDKGEEKLRQIMDI